MARQRIAYDRADIAGLNRALNRLARASRKELRLTVTDGSKIFVRKAVSATPQAKRRTQWVYAPGPLGQPIPVFIEEGISTPGRAYAKAGFARAGARLGISSTRKNGKGKGEYVDKRRALKPTFRIINSTPYIGSLDRGGRMPELPDPNHIAHSPAHNIEKKALARATVAIDRRAARETRRALERAWRF